MYVSVNLINLSAATSIVFSLLIDPKLVSYILCKRKKEKRVACTAVMSVIENGGN